MALMQILKFSAKIAVMKSTHFSWGQVFFVLSSKPSNKRLF